MKTKHFLAPLVAVACAATLVACVTSSDERRALALGWVELSGLKATAELPSVDRIEINLVASDQPTDNTAPGFPVFSGDGISRHRILGRKLATGPEAAQLLGAWRTLHTSAALSGMCHEPGYGLRFFHGTKLVLETSVCFKCQNFVVPVPKLGSAYCGFDAQNEAGRRVFNLLTNHVPLVTDTAK